MTNPQAITEPQKTPSAPLLPPAAARDPQKLYEEPAETFEDLLKRMRDSPKNAHEELVGQYGPALRCYADGRTKEIYCPLCDEYPMGLINYAKHLALPLRRHIIEKLAAFLERQENNRQFWRARVEKGSPLPEFVQNKLLRGDLGSDM